MATNDDTDYLYNLNNDDRRYNNTEALLPVITDDNIHENENPQDALVQKDYSDGEKFMSGIRIAMVLTHISAMISSIYFAENIPKCLGYSDAIIPTFFYTSVTGLILSVFNVVHLYLVFPKLPGLHWVLTGLYNTVLCISAILRIASSLTSSSAAYLSIVASVLGGGSTVYSMVSHGMKKDDSKRELMTRGAQIIAVLDLIILLAFCIMLTASNDIYFFPHGFTVPSSAGVPAHTMYPKSWLDNGIIGGDAITKAFKNPCQKNYDISHTFNPVLGGTIEEYGLLKVNGSDSSDGCCYWHWSNHD